MKVEVFQLIPVESPVSLKSNNLNLTDYKSVAAKLLGFIFKSESLSYLTLDILIFCTIFVCGLSKMWTSKILQLRIFSSQNNPSRSVVYVSLCKLPTIQKHSPFERMLFSLKDPTKQTS